MSQKSQVLRSYRYIYCSNTSKPRFCWAERVQLQNFCYDLLKSTFKTLIDLVLSMKLKFVKILSRIMEHRSIGSNYDNLSFLSNLQPNNFQSTNRAKEIFGRLCSLHRTVERKTRDRSQNIRVEFSSIILQHSPL